jgi:UDP-N-acetylglucosamine 1-carboxyvinyltransferase
MRDSYIIQGGNKLTGEVSVSGAKNASIKLMIASVIFDSPVVIQNIPHNQDNFELINLLTDLGAIAKIENNFATIDATGINKHEVSLVYGSKIRSSILLLGPLLRRFGKARIPNPGGCRIGARPIDRLINGFKKIGVQIKYDSNTGYYDATLTNNIGGEYEFEKPSHTGTEALILASAVGNSNKTVTIKNSALEPEIDDLIRFLNDAGADIRRVDGSTIIIKSVKSLMQRKPHIVVEDRNEAVTFAALAFATKGDITIKNIDSYLIDNFIDKVVKAGGGYEKISSTALRFFYKQRLKATNITTSPHPGFMTDWQPQWGLMMSMADGVSIIHETMLESRLNYVQELQKVGAKIEFFQPDVLDPSALYQFAISSHKSLSQAVRVTGVEKLHNGALKVHDLRAGAVVVMAGLSAEGESVVDGVGQIERGYELLIPKLKNLGARIKRI